eukprot:503987_1
MSSNVTADTTGINSDQINEWIQWILATAGINLKDLIDMVDKHHYIRREEGIIFDESGTIISCPPDLTDSVPEDQYLEELVELHNDYEIMETIDPEDCIAPYS